jgi:tetratricopeptide (TPR) repeat protein/glycosyltransferase involved in cell wall biosynthesis
MALAPETDVATSFRAAVRAHLGGDAVVAEAAYRRVLKQSPGHVQSLNNLATICAATGRRDEAAAMLANAIGIEPAYGEALNNFALLHNEAGNHAEAREFFLHAVTCDPANHDWCNNLGNACVELGNFDEALRAYDAAISTRPGDASYWSNRGVALRGTGASDEAVRSFEHAVAIDPSQVNALSNLGILYKEQRRFDFAIEMFLRALSIAPDMAALYANFATVYEALGDFERMRELAQAALEREPSSAEAINLLANFELEAGRLEQAERLYWKALGISPDNKNANWNLAIIWLLRGEYEMGWRQFEWRKRLHPTLTARPGTSGPGWDGSPLEGRHILLTTEQGLGDTLQFIRYAQLVRQAGAGRVTVECPAAVRELVATVAGVDEVVATGEALPAHDTHASVMSLPHLLGTTLDTIPASVPYLRSGQRDVAERVTAAPGVLKVGIVWAGNPIHPRDHLRSIPLADLARVFDVPGAQFFSLQKGGDSERDLHDLGDDRVVDLAPYLDDFGDTAAAIEQLDLVIAVDTSVAHLTGALGKAVWILLPAVPDYRWLLDRTESPWYPTAKLFRQPAPRQWDDVVVALTKSLCRLTGTELPAPRAAGEAYQALPVTRQASRVGIGIDWELRSDTGWGVYGTQLALCLTRRPDVQPTIFSADEAALNPLVSFELAESLREMPRNRSRALTNGVMLHGLGNNFQSGPLRDRIQARRHVGVIFFEDAAFDAAAIEKAKSLDLIVAGSTWNADVLLQRGLDRVVTCLQGVDTSVFHPQPVSGRFADRFVVFSGGKLEFRKGQDIVVAAFRAFRERHPEALLLTAWHNAWTDLATDLDQAGHVVGAPAVTGGTLRIGEWLAANGIPASAALEIGRQPNAVMGSIVREADVAIFPNRCEGGTNLVAMECMAAGIPTIVSANTGHHDLIATGGVLPLRTQRAVPVPRRFFKSTEGWGESDVDELVETLEGVWRDRQVARQRAITAADAMRDWSWPRQVDRLVSALAPVLNS